MAPSSNAIRSKTIAICVLPDHLHAIWSLPEDDANFPLRWNLIKSGFSRALPGAAARSPSKIAKREKGIWQRRYWEHVIRDEADLARHVDYIPFQSGEARARIARLRLAPQQLPYPRGARRFAGRLGR